MVYGYARVSTEKQVLKRQIAAIKERYPDAVIYSEKFTGTTTEGREKWKKLLDDVKPGDKIVFDAVSRMSRSEEDGVRDYMELYARGVELEFISQPTVNTEVYRQSMERTISVSLPGVDEDLDKYISGMVNLTNDLLRSIATKQIRIAYREAQTENEQRSRNIKKGLAEKKRDGVPLGRPKGSTGETEKARKAKAEIRRLSATFDGKNNDTEVCTLIGISRNSFKKYRDEMLREMGAAE